MTRAPVERRPAKKARPAKKRGDTSPITKGNMQVRVVSLAALIAVVFVVLGARLWYLQVLTGEEYNLSARATQTREVKIPAQRGVIYDRDGEILANNIPGLNVTVVPDEISRGKVEYLARAVDADAAVQNGGTLVTPHVGKEILDQRGAVVERISPAPTGRVEVSSGSLENTLEGLRMVTAEEGTAGYAVSDSLLPLVGKTGTGEMWGKDPVNWFAGWAEGQESPLVVVAMVEGGGAFETGSEMTAAPAARHVLEAYHGAEPSPRDPFPAASSGPG